MSVISSGDMGPEPALWTRTKKKKGKIKVVAKPNRSLLFVLCRSRHGPGFEAGVAVALVHGGLNPP